MTAVQQVRARQLPGASTSAAPRLIVVGVGDPHADEPALRWAATDALPGDVVHIVRAFVPLRLDGCRWDPVRMERDHRALAAERAVARSMQRLRTMRVDLEVGGSAVAGLADDVLVEFSQVVDLVVMGDDTTDSPRGHRLTWRVRDLAACPVISVPRTVAGFPEHVSVVVDERGPVPETLRFATEWAQRHAVDLRVCHVRQPLREGRFSATCAASAAGGNTLLVVTASAEPGVVLPARGPVAVVPS
jgi:hypothetical protein